MSFAPDVLPILSRGKHRSPRQGACFMELASFLAGERWTDHPRCTHPLLAEVARSVNDRVSTQARRQLAPLIPEVIGLTTDDPRADPLIALQCSLVALPTAPIERQRALAVGVISCLRVLDALGDDTPYELRLRARRALEQAPHAAHWAERFARRAGGPRHETSVRRFRRNAAHEIVKLAARGAEQSVDGEADAHLRAMLVSAIETCRALQPPPVPVPAQPDPEQWRSACALTT
jgi:hypothetical protein